MMMIIIKQQLQTLYLLVNYIIGIQIFKITELRFRNTYFESLNTLINVFEYLIEVTFPPRTGYLSTFLLTSSRII